MNTTSLETFLVLSKIRNFTKASEALFVAQSTVTNRIAELEKRTGTAIIYPQLKEPETDRGRYQIYRLRQPYNRTGEIGCGCAEHPGLFRGESAYRYHQHHL